MPSRAKPTILIVGGGASGALMARQAWERFGRNLRVVVIEKTGALGRGIAYASPEDGHVLNVRAEVMGGLPEKPGDFWAWIEATGRTALPTVSGPGGFVPRHIFGDYLETLSVPLREQGVLELVRGVCVGVVAGAGGVSVRLDDGRAFDGDALVLATGNEAAPGDGTVESGWARHVTRIAPDAAVLIKGAGLTMIDTVVTLCRCGHRGRIFVVSRRGLLPRVNDDTVPLKRDRPPPLGLPVSRTLAWVRREVDAHVAAGGNWRAVIDSLRPFLPMIWRGWPMPERQRFVRHLRPYWDVHRHRTAPAPYANVETAIAAGRLKPIAAKLLEVREEDAGLRVTLRRRGGVTLETLVVDHVVDCTGVSSNPANCPNPVIRALLGAGLIRADASGMGIEVAETGHLVAADGSLVPRVYGIGPVARAAFWEIVAISEIRQQAADIAARLYGELGG